MNETERSGLSVASNCEAADLVHFKPTAQFGMHCAHFDMFGIFQLLTPAGCRYLPVSSVFYIHGLMSVYNEQL